MTTPLKKNTILTYNYGDMGSETKFCSRLDTHLFSPGREGEGAGGGGGGRA